MEDLLILKGHLLAVANRQDVADKHRVVPGLALECREPCELRELVGGCPDRRLFRLSAAAQAGYVSAETSRALPMLSSRVLTEYLKRMEQDGEFNTILAFDEWLQSLPC